MLRVLIIASLSNSTLGPYSFQQFFLYGWNFVSIFRLDSFCEENKQRWNRFFASLSLQISCLARLQWKKYEFHTLSKSIIQQLKDKRKRFSRIEMRSRKVNYGTYFHTAIRMVMNGIQNVPAVGLTAQLVNTVIYNFLHTISMLLNLTKAFIFLGQALKTDAR